MLLHEFRINGNYTLLEMATKLGIKGSGAPTSYKRIEEGLVRPNDDVVRAACGISGGKINYDEIMKPWRDRKFARVAKNMRPRKPRGEAHA